MKRILFLLLSLGALCMPVNAQNEANHWFFGPGLDFTNGAPVPDNNGARPDVGEGCATISDANGNLLFYTLRRYTDFDTIFNRLHQPMANGDGILGHGSAVQSSLIIKKPGSAHIYYLFSQTSMGLMSAPNGLYYSEINMSLAGGNGSVTAKNVPVYTNATWGQSECMAGVRHCNGTDYWVMTRDLQQLNRYRCFLVSSSGVSSTAVISTVGPSINAWQGQIKFSPNGRKVAVTLFGQVAPTLFDFNPATGMMSNPFILNANANFSEFSPDGTKYYAIGGNPSNYLFYQWDLCAGSSSAILNSLYTYTLAPSNGSRNFGDLQLAPDGKIYLTSYSWPQNNFVSVIAAPNLAGAACNFIMDGQSVGNRVAYWALPNFVSSYFKQLPAPFTFTAGTCMNASFNVPALPSASGCSAAAPAYTGLTWNFGDPASGAQNQSTLAGITHNFSAPGTYTIKLILHTSCGADTLRKTLTVTNPLNVSASTTICAGAKATLTASGASTYSWSNGATGSSSIQVNPAVTTTYVVTGTVAPGCVLSQPVVVKISACTGTEENSAAGPVLVYPNPVGNELNIEHAEAVEIIIFDISGSKVYQATLQAGEQKIDLSAYSKGIYFLGLNGKSSKNIKLLKTE